MAAMDAQTLLDAIVACDDQTALAIVTAVVKSKPQLAPPLVNFMVPDLSYPPTKAMTDRRATGIVKTFQRGGYGFITCPEISEVFGVDVFLHSRQGGDLTVGQTVSFAVLLNKESKPQAYDVMVESGIGKGMVPVHGSAASGLRTSCGGTLHMGEAPDTGMKRPRPNVQEVLGDFAGTIKSFNHKSGYGFIECPDLKALGTPNDVFLHHQQLGGFNVGSTVLFCAYMNHKGQPQAKDLKDTGAAFGGIDASGTATGGGFSGGELGGVGFGVADTAPMKLGWDTADAAPMKLGWDVPDASAGGGFSGGGFSGGELGGVGFSGGGGVPNASAGGLSMADKLALVADLPGATKKVKLSW